MTVDDATCETLEKKVRQLEAELRKYRQRVNALHANERDFAALIDTIPHGIQENTIDGIITFSNHAHHEILGYRDGELIGKSITEFIWDPNEKQYLPELLDQLATEQPVPEPYYSKNVTQDGRVVDVQVDWNYKRNARDEVVGFISVITDITGQLEGSRALVESEQRYRAIFEGSMEGIVLVDIETLQFRFANSAVCNFLGYSPQELVTLTVPDIHPQADIEWVLEAIKTQARGANPLAEQIPCRRKDGRIVYADIRSGSVELEGRQYVVGFFSDITSLFKIKSELSEQVMFLQTLIDTLPHPIFYKDTSARYLGCNKAFEDYIGFAKEELVGKSVYDIAPRELADIYHRTDKELFASPRHQIYEADVRYADGTQRSVIFNKAVFYHKDGRQGGLVGAMIDITERKRAEAEKELLATAIEQSPELIIITDLHGIIHYVNAAFERISGYSREEAIGKSPALLRSGFHASDHYRHLWKTLEAGDIWVGRLTNRRKDGSHFEVEATIVPVKRKNGEVTDYLSVERDISQELLREKQMRQAQKMEAIGTLAGGIAHDFNNILSAIVGYTDIALHDLPAGSPLNRHLTKVLKAGDRARLLVNQILAFSRASEKASRPVVVQIIVKEVLKLMQATFPSTIAIHSRLDSPAAILADPTQIHQVIMNLCTNAAHAMRDKGGRLTVILEETAIAEGEVKKGRTLEAGAYLKLTVMDTGEGIADESIERIFDPFYTTKKPGEGTGMGLAMVHGIIMECGGAIDVQSKIQTGTVFEILLPIIDNEPDAEMADEKPLPVGNERILFVDDEPDIVDIGVQMLGMLGYRVTAVSNSPEALKRFSQSPDDFDLVLTDMTMPNMTGDLLGQKLLAIRPDIPIIICTGYSEKLTDVNIQSLGFASIAYKPLIIKDVAELIRKTLDGDGRQETP